MLLSKISVDIIKETGYSRRTKHGESSFEYDLKLTGSGVYQHDGINIAFNFGCDIDITSCVYETIVVAEIEESDVQLTNLELVGVDVEKSVYDTIFTELECSLDEQSVTEDGVFPPEWISLIGTNCIITVNRSECESNKWPVGKCENNKLAGILVNAIFSPDIFK